MEQRKVSTRPGRGARWEGEAVGSRGEAWLPRAGCWSTSDLQVPARPLQDSQTKSFYPKKRRRAASGYDFFQWTWSKFVFIKKPSDCSRKATREKSEVERLTRDFTMAFHRAPHREGAEAWEMLDSESLL